MELRNFRPPYNALEFHSSVRCTFPTTLSPIQITTNSAILQGTVNPNGSTTLSWFEGFTNTPAENFGSGSTPVGVSYGISNLAPSRYYDYRIVATNDSGRANGDYVRFLTLGSPLLATTLPTSLTPIGGQLNGIVIPNGFPTLAWFQWDTSTAYRNSTPLQTLGGDLQYHALGQALNNLQVDTTYYFRVAAQNTNGFVQADDHTFVLGPKDKALAFNGTNAYVQLSPVPTTNNQLTVEAWVKPADITSEASFEIARQQASTFGNYTEFPDWMLTFKNAGAALAFGLWSSPGFPSSYHELLAPIAPRDFVDGRWHHIAATYDGTTKKLYHNGVQIALETQSGPFVFAGTAISVGSMAWGKGEFFNGLIDEVRIWQVARTQSELIQTMNQPLNGNEPGLLTYLRFNEGKGEVTIDSSSHGNSGALIHTPAWTVSDALYQPYCVALPVTNFSNVTARLDAAVNPGGLDITVWFEFGTTTNFESRTSSQPAGNGSNKLLVSEVVSNLMAGTLYYARCVGSNVNGIFFSPPVTFLTSGPQAVTLPPGALTETAMLLNGAISDRGLATKFWFEWGTNANYGFSTPVQTFSYNNASSTISNLLVGQTYHFRVMATNSSGLATGQDLEFTPLFALSFSEDYSSPVNVTLAWAD